MTRQDMVSGATDTAGTSSERTLERDVPFSQSLIWRVQREFYSKRSLKAWTEDHVPSYITNNPFIAEIYAEIIEAFIQDCRASQLRGPSRENPLCVFELGAGTGKFAYLLLRKLTALLRARDLPSDVIRYVMTECSESMVSEWRGNAWLAEFVSQGILDFKVFEAGESAPKTAGPLVVIANYVFDSLPQDAFAVDHGDLHEILLTTCSASESQSFENLRFSFKHRPISSAHYQPAEWNSILEEYRTRVASATVLFPATTLKTLQKLGEAGDGRMLVLAADKGISHEEDLALLQGDPTLEFHASRGCFSQLVNFDAIGKYFQSKGGEALLPQKHLTSLNLCAFLQYDLGEHFPVTRRVYQHSADAFGPDDLFAVMSWLHDRLDQVPLAQAIALLRLTRWDATAFARLFPVIARHARNAGPERADLRDIVLRTWENHYPLYREENILAFYCGVVLLELRFFSEAYEMFRKSQQLFEPSAATSYNLALCCQGMNQPAEALALMREACALDPKFEPAQQSRIKLEGRLE